MINEKNNYDYIDNNKKSFELNILNNFLYKFIITNIIINLLLRYISNEYLAAIAYTLMVVYFFYNFRKYYQNYFITLFAQCFVVFLINLTYLTYIGTLIVNNLIFNIPCVFLVYGTVHTKTLILDKKTFKSFP